MQKKLVLQLFTLIFILTIPLSGSASKLQQTSAASLLELMTPKERIGQLFILSFNGSDPSANDIIYELIKEHHISGVVFRADHNNITDASDMLTETRALIAALQNANYEASLSADAGDSQGGNAASSVYVPLFIGIAQEGGGAPQSEIRSGLTPLPSEMAIGATWDSSLARAVGEVLGFELQALGFNLLLGPSLDVLEDPRLAGPGDLGVRAFGGDPYWVTLMGQAYIEGVHRGSSGRVGVIAKHFPGLGGGDRPAEEEVATVRKSLSQLQQIDLVPFFAVASDLPGESPAIADGFLSSNIRYQGFQGNIRATTRPVSLDQDANDQLMALDELSAWREGGGVTMSDALGSRALRRFIESLGQSFQGHIIAKDAFLAGNDLLYLDGVRSDNDPDEITTVKSTLAFFTQKYIEDAVFTRRVDEAVLRILKLKLRMYGNDFQYTRVIPDVNDLTRVGTRSDVTIEVARNSATLISPIQIGSEDRLSNPPKIFERVVFFTDSFVYRQCSTCALQSEIPTQALEDAIIRLYGQRAAGLVGAWNLVSYSTADLANYLGDLPKTAPLVPLASSEEVGQSLVAADWVIFTTLRSSDDDYGSSALKHLLESQPELVLDKNVVVFSHDVPYDLDATDISKIDVYYSLYSKSEHFIEYAARLLFQEALAEGNSPVSIPGIGYNLIQVTAPDPDQLISISLTIGESILTADSIQENVQVGEVTEIKTGIILDQNGNPVPDGTPVDIFLSYQGENIPALQLSATTRNGIASVTTTLDRPGNLSIRAESLAARISDIFLLNVQGDSIADNAQETSAEEATQDPQPSSTPGQSPQPTTNAPGSDLGGGSTFGDATPINLIFGLLGVALVAGVAYFVIPIFGLREHYRTRFVILAIVGALVGYDYIALGLPGSEWIFDQWRQAAGLPVAFASGALSLALALAWRYRKQGI